MAKSRFGSKSVRKLSGGDARRATEGLRLGVAGVMLLGAFGQKPFAAALPPARERGASGLCLHARTKAMLPFAGSLGSLESAFHNDRAPGGWRVATVKGGRALSKRGF